MKTTISNFLLGICCSTTLLLTSCIDSVFSTEEATEDQINTSEASIETLLWAMPASLNTVGVVDKDEHWDWGYGSIMHVRDVMTGDMPVVSSDYNWYADWEQNTSQGEGFIYSQFIWNFYWKSVLACNKLLLKLDEKSTTDETYLGYIATAHAFRAFLYLDMAQMYEYLPTDVTSPKTDAGNDVTGLTVPIVREGITEQEARNNPRASREEMATFILEELDKAEAGIAYLTEASKALPHIDAVYGLKARYYMWLQQYGKAKEYARKAIDASKLVPMSEEECLSTTRGFNQISCWMWGGQLVSEDATVKTGILNWTSWMSNETSFGYSSQAPYLMISASMYDRIKNTDFRKKMWKAPEGSALAGQTEFLTSKTYGYFGDRLCDYASVKFRPGEGNTDEVTVGAVTAYPLMRVEEMYFIEAEAAAQENPAEGKMLLEAFMQEYRDPKYTCTAAGDGVIEEIIFQKRVELWGEGQAFFDIKRLNMSVTRGYESTNYSEAVRFNTQGRPAWMNLCIVQTEKNNNKALVGFENPDPSGKYQPWKE